MSRLEPGYRSLVLQFLPKSLSWIVALGVRFVKCFSQLMILRLKSKAFCLVKGIQSRVDARRLRMFLCSMRHGATAQGLVCVVYTVKSDCVQIGFNQGECVYVHLRSSFFEKLVKDSN